LPPAAHLLTTAGPFAFQIGRNLEPGAGCIFDKINQNRFCLFVKIAGHQKGNTLNYDHFVIIMGFIQNQTQAVAPSGFDHGQADLGVSFHLLHKIHKKIDSFISYFQHSFLLHVGLVWA